MILIADSGSTKTNWALTFSEEEMNNGQHQLPFDIKHFCTQGINPVYMSEEHIVNILNVELIPQLSSCGINEKSDLNVYFYGAGCREEFVNTMFAAFKHSLYVDETHAFVQSDMMAAAHALCGRKEGIACILGTGSNSCLYDGERIVKNVSPMGFILGDEGSGAVLGKSFLNFLFKGNATKTLMEDFINQTGLTLTDIINKVYKEPLPNRFLASLAPFIHEHLDVEEVRQMVIDNFRLFFTRNIQHYHSCHLPVNAVGSIAYHFEECLRQAAQMEGYVIGKIIKSPIVDLVKYHQKYNE